MEKLYNVVVNKGVDLEQLDKELAAITGDDKIPQREVQIANPLVGNTRTTQWLLTEKEAEALRKDERVSAVQEPQDEFLHIVGSGSVEIGEMLRTEEEPRGSSVILHDRRGLTALRKAAYNKDINAKIANWGIGRHQYYEDKNLTLSRDRFFYDPAASGWLKDGDPFGGQSVYDAMYAVTGSYGTTYDYDYDGEGVDIVVIDTGVQKNNPEWNDVNGNSRFQAIDWIQVAQDNGHTLVDNDGNALVQHEKFYEDINGHGTCCAALAAGLTSGFAKGAHIYGLKATNLGVPYEEESHGFTLLECLTLVKIWHENKGNDRPTILNLSLGFNTLKGTPDIFVHKGEVKYRYPHRYKHPTDLNGNVLVDDNGDPYPEVPYIHDDDRGTVLISTDDMKDLYGYRPIRGHEHTYYMNVADAAIDAVCEDLLDAGVHITKAAGNDNAKLDVDPNDPESTVRSNYFNNDQQGEMHGNVAYYEFADTATYDAYGHFRKDSPASTRSDIFLVGSLSPSKFDDPFGDGIRFLDNGVPYNATTSLANKNEVKSDFSNVGNAVNIWAAGEEMITSNNFQKNFERGVIIDPTWVYDLKRYHRDSDMFNDNWDRYVYNHDFEGDMTRGFKIEYDTASQSGRLRAYLKLDADYISELKSKGIEELISLRTFIHFDENDARFSNFNTAFQQPERLGFADNYIVNPNATYSTQYNFGGNALDTAFGIDSTYSIISHDIDFGDKFQRYDGSLGGYRYDVRLNTPTTRRIYEANGSVPVDIDKTCSFYRASVKSQCIYLQATYLDFDDDLTQGVRDFPTVGVNLDLNDTTLPDRVLFEINLPLSEFGDVDTDFEGLFQCGGTVANIVDDEDLTRNSRLDVTKSLETNSVATDPVTGEVYSLSYFGVGHNVHFQGAAYAVYSGTSMAAPLTAGMLATHLEKEGNMTPRELVNHMTNPNTIEGKPSITEVAEVGYKLNQNLLNLSYPYTIMIEGEDKEFGDYIDWQNFNTHWDFGYGNTYSLANRAITGNKHVARVAKDEDAIVENPVNLSIKGEYNLETGEAFRNADVKFLTLGYSITVPAFINIDDRPLGILELRTRVGASHNTTPLTSSHHVKQLNMEGELIFGNDEPLLNNARENFDGTVNAANGDYSRRYTFTNELAHPTLVQTSKLTATLNGVKVDSESGNLQFLPKLPTIQPVGLSVNVAEDAVNPTVYSVSTHLTGFTTYIDEPNNTGTPYFAVDTNTQEVYLNRSVDAENANERQLDFDVWIEDIYGRESNRLTVIVNVTDADEFAPYFLRTNFNDLNQDVDASDRPAQLAQVNNTIRFRIKEHNNVAVDLVNFTWTDNDYSQDGSDVTTTLEVVAHDGSVYSSADNEVSPFILTEDNGEYTVSLPANAFSFEHPEEDLKSGATHHSHTYLFRIKGVSGSHTVYEDHYLDITNLHNDNAVDFVNNVSEITLNFDEDTAVGTVLLNILDYVDTSNNDAPYTPVVVGDAMYANPNNYPLQSVYIEANGDVKLNAALDFETNETVKFNIAVYNKYEADWQDSPNMTPSVFSVIVNVGDVEDSPPTFVDGSGNIINHPRERITNTVEHGELSNGIAYSIWDDIETQHPCTFTIKSFTITQGTGRTDDADGDYIELYDYNTNSLLSPTTETDRVSVRFASDQFPDADVQDSITGSGGVYTINQAAALQFEAEIEATNAYGSRTFTLKSNSTIDTVLDTIDVPSLTTSTFSVSDGTAAGTTIGTLASSATLGIADSINNNTFVIIPQFGHSSDPTPSFGSPVDYLNIDANTGVITLSADADYATKPNIQFLVGTRELNSGLLKFTLVNVNVLPSWLQTTTMTTGHYNHFYGGNYYGFSKGYIYYGTMNNASNTDYYIPSVFPSISNARCSGLYHNANMVRFVVNADSGTYPDTDTTWSELHIGSNVFYRANVTQKLAYSSNVQYRWTASNPFGTTTLNNDPSVVRDVKWK